MSDKVKKKASDAARKRPRSKPNKKIQIELEKTRLNLMGVEEIISEQKKKDRGSRVSDEIYLPDLI